MKKKWWHNKIAYQIYPKSFMDSNGDGIGDLQGVIQKLDYLKQLGIDIIWLSPIYKSPFVDQGYDISDYYAIAEEFGTMEDFDELLTEAKKRDMHIVMDLVINHCSDQHEWFQKALKDPYGKYADYFYFRKGKDGNPPTNYRSYFGGSAWEKIEGTDLYYLHYFAKEQPDLNWENPEVLEELYKMINWWLEKGVSGFRIDAIINIQKDLDFPNYPADDKDGLVRASIVAEKTPGIGKKLHELKIHTFDRYDAFTVGEVFNMRKEELEEFVGEDGHFSTMFDFTGEVISSGEHGWFDGKPFDLKKWRDATFEAQRQMEGIGLYSNIIENHDEPRGASRYLPEYAQNPMGIKMLATISVLLKGIPFIYQGQEIGMTNVRRNSIEEYDDISTKNEYKCALEAGYTNEEALEICYQRSRDNARTPMQWSEEVHAGFTTGIPWLPENPNYKVVNVKNQERDQNSVLNYYRRLLAFRKDEKYEEVLTYGVVEPMYQEENMIFAYKRVLDEKEILVIANMSNQECILPLNMERKVLFGNYTDRKESVCRELPLRALETVILK